MTGHNTQFGRLQRGLAPCLAIFFGVVAWFHTALPCWAALDDVVEESPSLPIIWSPSEAMNVTAAEVVNEGYYVLRLTSSAHNWVAGRAFFLPTGRDLTLGFSLEGHNTRGNVASVAKWVGLRMLRSYADPSRYTSYEAFTKDEHGRWHSTDIFRQGALDDAGTGRVPEQSAVPEDVADECLSPDGRSWSAFCEIEACEAVPSLNIFRIKTRVAYPSMVVAMRVPYLSRYLLQITRKVGDAHGDHH